MYTHIASRVNRHGGLKTDTKNTKSKLSIFDKPPHFWTHVASVMSGGSCLVKHVCVHVC